MSQFLSSWRHIILCLITQEAGGDHLPSDVIILQSDFHCRDVIIASLLLRSWLALLPWASQRSWLAPRLLVTTLLGHHLGINFVVVRCYLSLPDMLKNTRRHTRTKFSVCYGYVSREMPQVSEHSASKSLPGIDVSVAWYNKGDLTQPIRSL